MRLDDSPLTHDQPEGAIAVRVEWGSVRVCTIFDGDAVRRNEQRRFVARTPTSRRSPIATMRPWPAPEGRQRPE